MRNLYNVLVATTPMHILSLLEQSNDLGEELVTRFLEWSESHTTLLRSVIILIFAVDVVLILAAVMKREWINDQLKEHTRVEKAFIVSFFATIVGGVSFLVITMGVLGLQHSGEFPLIGFIAVGVIGLPLLAALLICFVTFLILFVQLFILMNPLHPITDEKVNWGGTPILVTVLTFFTLTTLLAFVSSTASSVVGSLLLIVLPIVLVVKTYKRPLNTLGFTKPVVKLFLLSLLLIFVLILGNEVVYWITEKIVGEFPLDELVEDIVRGSPLLMSVYVGIIGPVGEELFFRGFAHTALRRKYGFRKGIVFSSLFFGLYHLLPWQIPYAVMAGFVLAYVYEKTQSIYPPIALHVLNNSIAVILIWV